MKNFKLAILFISILIFVSCVKEVPDNEPAERYGVFSFSDSLTLPGTPEYIYDNITGDISGWWDHSFSEKPFKFFIEAKPGGGFYEYFDEEGNGVLHATVIYAERGKLFRMDGPLGLSGKAIQIVTTYKFNKVGTDSTQLIYEINASGQMNDSTENIVKRVWKHFMFNRFKPFIEERGEVEK